MTDGRAAFLRRKNGAWLEQSNSLDSTDHTKWQHVAGVNKFTSNELRVTTEGNKARLYVNGKLFREVIGEPPKGGFETGLMACAFKAKKAVVEDG